MRKSARPRMQAKQTKRKGKVGRPSLIYDEARVERLLDAIGAGNWMNVACTYAGIHEQTVRNWLDRGREARNAEEDGRPVPEDDLIYVAFLDRFLAAESGAEVRVVANLMRQSASSPQAATGMLKMRWPKRWRDAPTAIEVSGPNAGPIALSPVLAEMTEDELAARIRLLEERVAENGRDADAEGDTESVVDTESSEP